MMKKPTILDVRSALLATFFLCPVYLSMGQISVPPSLTITNSTNTTTTSIGLGTLTVTGTNALVSNSGSLTVGDGNDNSLLVISNGATFLNTSANVSVKTQDKNNGVIVTGLGSVWSNSGLVTIGVQGTGFLVATIQVAPLSLRSSLLVRVGRQATQLSGI